MKRKIEVSVTSTGKPSISVKVDDVTGQETTEERDACFTVAWEEAQKDIEKMLRVYGQLNMKLR